MDIAAAVVQGLLALVFLASGGMKLAGAQMQLDNFERYGYPQWSRPLTGAIEVAGAAGMVAGLFVDQIAITAAVALGVTMIGAAYTDIRYSPPMTVVAPLVLLGLNVTVAVLVLAD